MGETNFKKEPLFYAGDEVRLAKKEKTRAALEKFGLDGLLFILPEAVRYFTDFYATGYRPFWELSYLTVVSKGRDAVLGYSSGSDDYRVRLRSLSEDIRKLPSKTSEWPKAISEILVDYGLDKGKIGVDVFPFDLYLGLKRECPKAEFVSASHIWGELTAIKHPLEIEIIKEATHIAMMGMRVALGAIRTGVSEMEVSAEAEYAMRKAGSEVNPFIPVILSGEHFGTMERVATPRIINQGDMVMVDLGCVFKGYVGEFGRTTIVGKANGEQRKMYRTVVDSLKKAIEFVKPGMKCSELDSLVREVIREAGYGKYEHKRATGHQLGYGLHGHPIIGPGVDYEIRPNMVINLEPRIQIYDNPTMGGVHIEDTLLVTEKGIEVLTTFKYDEELLQ